MAYIKVISKGPSAEERAAALERALKIFKRQVEREGILKDLKRKEEFISKSVRRKMKREEAIKRQRRSMKNRAKYFKRRDK